MRSSPYLVAELSGNHHRSLDRALALVDHAAAAGADAIKVQTWTPGTMAKPGYVLDRGPWKGRELSALYEETHLPWDWHAPIFERARERGIEAFASVFDLDALAFLESIGCPRYKIASFELVDLPLISAAARTRKPVIMSTGMADAQDIGLAVASGSLSPSLTPTLLVCTSSYPAPVESAGLCRIATLRREWNVDVGLSDHTREPAVCIAAAALGATVIEAHFTLARSDGGPDAEFSYEPAEFAQMARGVRVASQAVAPATVDAEGDSRGLRRSLYAARDIEAGEPITADCLRSARPALGLPAIYLSQIVRRHAARRIAAWEPITADLLAPRDACNP